jgi:alginate O-acetyltransferase complex protein AlgJ
VNERLRIRLRFPRAALAGAVMLGACATSGARFPWQIPGATPQPGSREDVVTVNRSYRRATAQVLVRRVTRATRASLDYAAYDANFMDADPPPEGSATVDAGRTPDTKNPFGGLLAADSLTGSIAATPLTAAERAHALAVAPLVELLTSKHIAGADHLEDVVARVRSESWGLGGGPQLVRQTAALAYLHDPGAGKPVELWFKIEFAPWFKAFSGMPDDDGDGFPNIYGRATSEALGDQSAVVAFIRTEYEGRTLSPAEVKGWAHQLASYWYPSYNTDLVAAPTGWPASDTEPAIVSELGGLHFASPTVVMRGKPQGKPVYNVFLTDDATDAPAAGTAPAPPALKLAHTTPSPAPDPVARAVKGELAGHGASWSAWSAQVAPLHAALKARLAAMPTGSKALAGSDGFLFFKQSIAYALGGDLGKQRRDRNPLPAITAFGKLLAKHGVDFLFVPVPTKAELFPDRAASTPGKDAGLGRFAGQVANPFERKFLLELAAAGVETVDLLPAFLASRAEQGKATALYQAQDTHWTSRGLELAAKLVAERIRRYPWYKELASHRRVYHLQDASFTRHGDLHSRLPENEKAGYAPETLVGHQVVGADGALYDDDPDSPVVLLGDSFTGVYELMDCEHAGVSAHLAKEIGYPLDLVMSYGGGPNVRQKLLRRGEDALGTKKLVIWMMTARDLYDFWEGWQPLGKQK